MVEGKSLVSIITPSYNCGKYIHRLLDSVYCQTYKDIEMFVVDDGSTDNTKEIVEPYIEKFANDGKKLQYIWQKNMGAPCAINKALKLINGKYFLWPDADDWYATDNAIEILVFEFENLVEDVGLVRGMQSIISEETLETIGSNGELYKKYQDNLFEQCLFFQKQWWWPPGAYMIKTEHLFDSYPNRDMTGLGINESYGGGQNFPLLLPSLYRHKSITVNKCIYNVLARKESISRREITYDYFINKRHNFLEKIVKNTILTIRNMPISEKEMYAKKVSILFEEIRFVKAFEYKQKKDCVVYYKKLFELDKCVARKRKWQYWFSQIPFGFTLYKVICLLRRILGKVKRKIKGVK